MVGKVTAKVAMADHVAVGVITLATVVSAG